MAGVVLLDRQSSVLISLYLFQLLATPMRKLWGGDLAKYQEYKQQETKEVKGTVFFCASDVKGLPAFKGSTGTSVLQVLRHLKRVKVVSGSGETRYVLP